MITTFFGPHIQDSVCCKAGLTPARALQNSGSLESMFFGKVHFAQEPSKSGDCAVCALKLDHESPGGRGGVG